MNIQGSRMVNTRKTGGKHGKTWIRNLALGAALCIAVMGIANSYVYMNQEISKADRDIRRIRAELGAVEREIDSYQLQYESYSAWPSVREAIARFHLPLAQATPEQCRRLVIVPPSMAPAVALNFQEPLPAENTVPAKGNVRKAAQTVVRAVPSGTASKPAVSRSRYAVPVRRTGPPAKSSGVRRQAWKRISRPNLNYSRN